MDIWDRITSIIHPTSHNNRITHHTTINNFDKMLTKGYTITGTMKEKIKYEQAKTKAENTLKIFIKKENIPKNIPIQKREWIFAGQRKAEIWIGNNPHI